MRSKAVAFWLCLFFGVLGIHRFYLGKTISGLIWLFTGGVFGVGYLLDVLRIAFNLMRDGNGYPLRQPGLFHNTVIKSMAILEIFWIIVVSIFAFYMLLFHPAGQPIDFPAPYKF